MAEEILNWIFVGFTPLLYERKRVAKQSQIETWLNLFQIIKELNIEKAENKGKPQPAVGYVI